MAPIAFGFLILIAAAAVLGVLAGALGGAVVWWARINLLVGGLLAFGAFALVLVLEGEGDQTWMRAKLIWGTPSFVIAFLLCRLTARWLEMRTTLRRGWISLLGFLAAVGLGALYLLLFRIDPKAPLYAAPPAAALLIGLLIWSRRPARS